jgi:hypothetical protein
LLVWNAGKTREAVKSPAIQIAIADRGYRGRSRWGDISLVIPGVPKKSDFAYVKQPARSF